MCVFDIHIVDTNADSYDWIHPHKILSQHKYHKKGKCIEACRERQLLMIPLVFSVDGVMG